MLIDVLKADRIQAMKDKETIKKDLLGTLIGEASKKDKLPTDTVVMATIKKFINNDKETINITTKSGDPLPDAVMYAITVLEKEIEILESYLPKQLNEEGMIVGIKAAMNLGANNIGDIMKFFKENFEGRYDGKTVNVLAQKALKGE